MKGDEGMKHRLMLLCIGILILGMSSAGTVAYYTAETRTHNVITTGNIDIAVIEQQVDQEKGFVDFPKEGIEGVMPGDSISKIVRIKNTGKNNAWIRVKLEVEYPNQKPEYNAYASNPEQKELITLSGTEKEWIYDSKDGFYYYNKILEPAEETTNLLGEVHLDPQMGNTYQNVKFTVNVSAQGVQSDNNGTSYKEAKGWQ